MMQELWETFSQFLDPTYLKKLLEENQFAQGGVVMGIAGVIGTALWTSLRKIPTRINTWIRRWTDYIVTIQEHNQLYDVMANYISKKYPRQLRNVEALYSPNSFSLKEDDELDEIIVNNSLRKRENKSEKSLKFLQYQDRYFILWKNKPLIVNKYREKLEGAREASNSHKDMITIRSFFGKKHINSFIETAIDSYEEENKKEFVAKMYTPDYKYWSQLSPIERRDIESVHGHIGGLITKDLDQFLSNEAWYKDRGIPYKRGYLFMGTPGNGKTTMIKAMAYYLKRDIYYMNINDIINDGKLQSLMASIGKRAILVIEDIDSFFNKREKKGKENNTISFSSLINSLDGVVGVNGLITIITTNKPESLDEALIRPGRIDVKLEFNNPEIEDVNDYIQKFFETKDLKASKLGKSRSYAELQHACILSDKSTIVKNLEDEMSFM